MGDIPATDLKLNTADLRAAGEDLLAVYREFSNAGPIAEAAADAIAHGRHRDRLREFADNWDDRGEQICDSINGLGEAAHEAAKVYEEIELELVRSLRGDG